MVKYPLATLETYRPVNLTDLRNVTFSQASEDGLTHSLWLDGPGTEKCGQEAVLASHSVSPEKAEELTTKDTFGPLFDGLSHNDDLQRSLESRLRARMDVNGSPEYVLTWKRWDMKSGPQICALRASGRPTSGSGCFGWPTPLGAPESEASHNQISGTFRTAMKKCEPISGWPTPTDSMMTEQDMAQAMTAGNGSQRKDYRESKVFAGWATPEARNQEGYQVSGGKKWPRLGAQAKLLNAETESTEGYLLNPLFSLWLQGYPKEWAYCVVPEMRLILG
jgi:hypothetical protein